MADRENGRIQCFIAETGEFVKEIKKDEFGGAVYAITYSPAGGELPPILQSTVRIRSVFIADSAELLVTHAGNSELAEVTYFIL